MSEKLTTRQAQEKTGIPGDALTSLCREGQLKGAERVRRRWLIPSDALDDFIAGKSNWRPPPSQDAIRIKGVINAGALILGLIVDTVAFVMYVQGASGLLMLTIVGLATCSVWLGSIYILRSNHQIGLQNEWIQEEPLYMKLPSFADPRLRRLAQYLAWGMPAVVVGVFIGYLLWSTLPPSKTVVLVTKLTDPSGIDSSQLTETVTYYMQNELSGHPNIVVKSIPESITFQEGSKKARHLANKPENKASVVIWGNYTLPPDQEMHIHFDIIRNQTTYLGSGTYMPYSPAQTRNPDRLTFKINLARHLGQMTAFASALMFFQARDFENVAPLLDTASRNLSDGSPGNSSIDRAIQLYRGLNHQSQGHFSEAESEFTELIEEFDNQTLDDIETTLWAISSLSAIKLVHFQIDESASLIQKGIQLSNAYNNDRFRSIFENGLGASAMFTGDFTLAQSHFKEALQLADTSGSTLEIIDALTNLGAIASVSRATDTGLAQADIKRGITLARKVKDPLREGMLYFVQSSVALITR